MDNALAVAQWLQSHPDVAGVSYPGLPSSPHHELAKRYLRNGFGGVLSFEPVGGAERAQAVIDALELFSHAANVGDAKSLVIQPSLTTHQQLGPEEQSAAGVTPGLIRLSIGIEHVDDLIADLDQALRRSR